MNGRERPRHPLPQILEWTKRYREPQDAEERGVYPFFHPLEEIGVTRVRVDGRERIMAGSNNYLGLTHHPVVVEANREATARYGTGLTGSRLLNGTMELHRTLERRLARFLGKEDALVFPAGYLANVGTLSPLVRRGDHIYLDRLVHASILDAAALTIGEVHRYPHMKLAALDRMLLRRPRGSGAIVVTDGVFSMDGDVADLPGLVEVCRHHDAALLVDDAHGLGVLGPTGAGTAEAQGATDGVDLLMGTFSKSLGSVGGVVAGRWEVVHYLRHRARPFLFTASLPPGSVAGVLAALDIVRGEPERRTRLAANAARLREGIRALGFEVLGGDTPVVPVVVGGRWWPTLTAWRFLFDAGVFVNAVLPPAVARNAARLRLSVTCEHTAEEIEAIVAAFAELGEAHPEMRTPPGEGR